MANLDVSLSRCGFNVAFQKFREVTKKAEVKAFRTSIDEERVFFRLEGEREGLIAVALFLHDEESGGVVSFDQEEVEEGIY